MKALVVFLSAALVGLCPGFLLDGSTNSYSQFRKWGVGTNGSLEFEFKTDQPNGLLLYTDDGGTYDFFEIKLVEGALRLRYNLGGGAQIITVGRDLNDGHWHKVHVQRNDAITTLSVDGIQQTSVSRGKEFQFGRFATNSEVFVGGMPTWYNTKLTLLALPSVIFEPRFVGAIRNLVYSDLEGGPPRRQETRPKDHKCVGASANSVGADGAVCSAGVTTKSHRVSKGSNGTDACESHDPCQHGGICISTDSGPICECRNQDYEGMFCEKGDLHGVAQRTVSTAVKRVSIALASHIHEYVKHEGLDHIKEEFYRIAGFPSVIGCVDCTHVKIKNPDKERPLLYCNRKGWYSLNVQVVCDAKCRIVDLVARWRGSAHDARIWDDCSMKQKLEAGQLGGIVLGDSGYPCTHYLLTPLHNPTTRPEERYNSSHIKTRSTVERCFGQWKATFRALQNGILLSLDTAKAAIAAMAVLHNIRINAQQNEEDKAPSEAVFRGTEYLSYDLRHTGGEPIVSAQDSVTFYFKTRQPNGLLFYTGDGTDYLNVAIKDGGLSLTMGLSNGKQEMVIKPNKVRFDDNQWHKVSVHRRIQEISAITSFCRLSTVVDGVYAEHSHIAGKFTMLSSSKVHVGGSINTRALPGSRVHSNFVGCMRKVEFVADTLRLNLIELGRTGSKLITVAGRLDFKCPEAEPGDPITFTTRDSHLVLPAWNAKKSGTLSFKFRTNEANGLILYNGGVRPPRSDFFAVEILNGHVYVHLDLGSGGVKVRVSKRRVDDGAWHELILRRAGRDAKATVDGNPTEFVTTGDSNQLELDGPMYIGGMGPPFTDTVPPAALWTAVLRQGYVGCLRDFNLNNKPVDIAGFARLQDSGSIKTLCHQQPPQCPSQPCLNGGLCLEGWNRFICDCTDTIFTGPTCGKEAPTLNFNGTQHMEVIMDGESHTQTEDLIIRFRTAKALGLLMTTNAEDSTDRIELSVAAGRVRLAVRLSDKDKILLAGQNVNDNEWHTVRFSRRASNLKLQLDSQPPIRAETILLKKSTLQIHTIHLGGLYHPEEEIRMTITVPNFVGSLQQFIFNGISYIDLAQSAPLEKTVSGLPHIKVAAKFITHSLETLHRPVTFRSKHTFVGLPMLRAYSTMHIDFMFKTRESNGLIFFNGGRKQDFIAVELVDGHLNYILNVGDGPIRLRDNIRTHLNDNRWHTVAIRRPTPKQHTLMVDDDLVVATTEGIGNLELEGILYLGGLHKDLYAQLPQELHSKHGFEGCLAGLDFNGESPNVLEDAVVHSSLVATGCEGQAAKCSHNVCANRGICVQQWHSYTCDCDMTSFTGPTCSDESVAYEFGPNRGIITYTFPEDRRPEMTEDSIALGFITTKSDAVLLRVVSGTSNDYIELEIVEGNVFMVYNMGTNDHPLGEISVKVNDNAYHVVRFRRSGANSTLQIDDFNVQTNHPSGHQLQVFNSQSQIQIGGKWNRNKSRVERPFTGILAGVVVNGLRVLDLAAEKDSHTSIRGDVQLMTGILERHDQKMQQTPASGFPGVMDDLIFSGAGSGCNEDDEDQCTPLFESGSGDDLITPVYVPPTRPPPTTSKVPAPKTTTCDDEDCDNEGSGDNTEEPIISSTVITHPSSISTSGEQTSSKGTEPNSDGTPSESPLPETSGPTTGQDGGGSSPPGGSSEFQTPSTFDTSPDTPGTSTHLADPSLQPPLYQPPYYPTVKTTNNKKTTERVSSELSEIIALIIGIIAGALIAVILIILVILKFKSRGDHSYKVDDGKGFQQGPNAALLGNASNGNGQTQYQMNGTVRNGDKGGVVLKKKRDSKDIKEWYV